MSGPGSTSITDTMRQPSPSEFDRKCAALEVATLSTAAELLKVYRPLINKWHPDRHCHDAAAYERATQRAMEINEAFTYLSELFERGLAPPKERTAAATSHEAWPGASANGKTHRGYGRRTYATGFPDASVIEVFVKSSNIVSIGYDRSGELLYIKFVGNAVYRYFGVSEAVFSDFLSAPSQGRFAHKFIYRHFRYENCVTANPIREVRP